MSLFNSWDAAIFQLINVQGQNAFFDILMPFITNLRNFYSVLAVLAIWLVWRDRKAGIIFLLFIAATLTLTDQFSSHLLKPWVGRIRPCRFLENVRLLTDCNTSYSFPSSHAVNIFAAAFFLSQPFKKLRVLWYGIAAAVGYSRIYIGIHYPFDVIGGGGIGLLMAWPMRRFKDAAVSYFCKKSNYRGAKSPGSAARKPE